MRMLWKLGSKIRKSVALVISKFLSLFSFDS